LEPLNKVLPTVFGASYGSSEDLCDQIRTEWKQFQCEENLPSFVMENEDKKKPMVVNNPIGNESMRSLD